MKTPLTKNISHLRASLNFALWMDVFGQWARVWLIVLGLFLVVVKTFGLMPMSASSSSGIELTSGISLSYIWLSVIPILIGVSVTASGNKFNNLDAAAWLDCKSKAGGRLIALAEGAPTGELMDAKGLAGSSLVFTPVLKRLALPAVFVLAAWLIPPIDVAKKVSPEAIRQRANVVKRRIEEAKNREVLEEEDELKLIDEVKHAVAQMHDSPEAAMEAVDQMQETLERSILKKAEQLQKAMENTAALASLADEALMMDEGAKNGEKSEAQKELEEKLAKALEDVIKEAERLDKQNALTPEAKQALRELMKQMGGNGDSKASSNIKNLMSKMTPEMMKKLATALSRMQQMKQANMGKCAKLMKSSDAKKMLEAMLKECRTPT